LTAQSDPQPTVQRHGLNAKAPAARRRTDPLSRPARLWTDGKGTSPEGVYIRQVREGLICHVGGAPSATQRILIERAVMQTAHLAQIDLAAMRSGGLSADATGQLIRLEGNLRRTLAALGMAAAAPRQLTLAEHLAARDRHIAA
jgi:hypothetical protein